MLDVDVRRAVFELRDRGQGIRGIARALGEAGSLAVAYGMPRLDGSMNPE